MPTPEKLEALWPRVRVGQRVRVRGGKIAEVISVSRARDVLLQLNDDQAVRLGARCASTYGPHWMKVYYEATCRIPGTMSTIKVSPNDIEAILGIS